MTYVDGAVRGPAGERRVRFLVDSGAVYTLVPHPIWEQIGLQPGRTEHFHLADGRPIERRIGEVYIKLPQGERSTPVILGEPGDATALLGMVTLEEMGLVLHPFSRQLLPMLARL